jgi:hypothetical protein
MIVAIDVKKISMNKGFALLFIVWINIVVELLDIFSSLNTLTSLTTLKTARPGISTPIKIISK